MADRVDHQMGSAAALPVDSDVDSLAPRHRPLHLKMRYVALVALGGAVGALARYALTTILPAPQGWPLPTLLINLAGAFALGALLEGLSRSGPDAGRLRVVRLLVGTGFMGAFTTYSTLALDAVHLFGGARIGAAFLYLAASLFGGAAATILGIWAASGHHRAAGPRSPVTAPGHGPGTSIGIKS